MNNVGLSAPAGLEQDDVRTRRMQILLPERHEHFTHEVAAVCMLFTNNKAAE